MTPGERTAAWIFGGGFVALLLADMLQGDDRMRYGMGFVALSWFPTLVLHELGHAWAARSVGFGVAELVIGHGPPLWRTRFGYTRVVLRAVPAGGYMVPFSRTGKVERAKLAWIYFWGPGAEMALIALLALIVGPDALLSPTQSIPLIAVQSLALAAAIGVVLNMLPLPLSDSVTDGLGMILSATFPVEAFEHQAAEPYVAEAEVRIDAGSLDGALAVIARGRQRLPDNRLIQIEEAVGLAASGDHAAAHERLEQLRALPELPPSIEAEALHAAARVVVEGGDTALLSEAERACISALELSAQPEHMLTLGRVQLGLGRIDHARASLMTAYKATAAPDREDRCLAYLAIAAHRAGEHAEAALYRDALRRRRPGVRLLQRVDGALGEPADAEPPRSA